MEEMLGKHFSITDPKDVNTVIYKINETEKEFLKDSPKYTVERLDYTEQIIGENKKKTFFIDEPNKDKDQLVILSFGKEKVVVNVGILEGMQVKISKKPKKVLAFSYGLWYTINCGCENGNGTQDTEEYT